MTITDIFPVSYQGAGRSRVQWVKTLATPSAPTLAEINGATSFDATCYFLQEGFEIGHEQERVDDTRLCDETTRESFGRSTFSLENLAYIYDPNDNTPNTPGNLAKGAFGTGESGYFVLRFGPLSAVDFAAEQIVEVYAVQFGTQHKTVPSGDNAKFTITQPLSLTRVAYDHVLTAP